MSWSGKYITKDLRFARKNWDLLVVTFRRSVLTTTRKLLKNSEKKLINRSIVNSHSKRWKQKNWLKLIIERLQDLLSVKTYIGLEIKNEKN